MQRWQLPTVESAAPVNPRLVVATGNSGKLREFRALLAGQPVELCSLREVAEFGEVALPEEGLEYCDNAIAKAMAVAEQLGLPAVADDSGLEVDALDGRPGPTSARYGGAGLDDAGRVAKLLEEVGSARAPGRGARFVCWAALALPPSASGETPQTECAVGECTGVLLERASGGGGFGYDPVFAPSLATDDRDSGRSMAQLAAARKNDLSHRARALRAGGLSPPRCF